MSEPYPKVLWFIEPGWLFMKRAVVLLLYPSGEVIRKESAWFFRKRLAIREKDYLLQEAKRMLNL